MRNKCGGGAVLETAKKINKKYFQKIVAGKIFVNILSMRTSEKDVEKEKN